jgi:uroporphyrinogen decarboxylase
MIEGQTRGDISLALRSLEEQPQTVRALLEKIARATAEYLKSQIAAGAAVIQLFDTWATGLTAQQYDEFERPATQLLFELLGAEDVPKILFAKGSERHLQSLAKTGADVLSVDSATDLAQARASLGRKVALQGNVDSQILFGPQDAIRRAAREAVEKTNGLGHILNLGHGILPGTPVANAKAFVEAGQSALLDLRAEIGKAD